MVTLGGYTHSQRPSFLLPHRTNYRTSKEKANFFSLLRFLLVFHRAVLKSRFLTLLVFGVGHFDAKISDIGPHVFEPMCFKHAFLTNHVTIAMNNTLGT